MGVKEAQLREQICAVGRSLFERGLTHGSTGNISVRLADGWLLTPTGSSLGTLRPEALSRLDDGGRLLSGDPPTKEKLLHLNMYAQRPRMGAVVHLHSTSSVGVSLLAETPPDSALPPLTAYYVMRIGDLPLVPYFPPGDEGLAQAVSRYAARHHALLLANHGPVVGGTDLLAATDAVEELEATARLYLNVRGMPLRVLTPDQVAELMARFPVQC